MNTTGTGISTRQAALGGLAVIGFIGLVIIGMWLAVYSTRYVPTVVGRFATAAVYLGSVFNKAPATGLSVVPTASTTISFGDATSTASTTPVLPVAPSVTPAKSVPSTSVPKVTTTYPINGTQQQVSLYGYPDLVVTIEKVGYSPSATTTLDDIIATTTIPTRSVVAVKFRVTNIGTNVSGLWTVNVSIPSSGNAAYQTFSQDSTGNLLLSLNPNETRELISILGNITPGSGRAITITIDPNHQLTESNISNNTATSENLIVFGN